MRSRGRSGCPSDLGQKQTGVILQFLTLASGIGHDPEDVRLVPIIELEGFFGVHPRRSWVSPMVRSRCSSLTHFKNRLSLLHHFLVDQGEEREY